MKEFIDKLIGRLEEESDYEPIDYDYCDMSCSGEEHFISTHKAISIVNQLAEEYNGGWIPVLDKLPDSGVSVIVSYKDRFLAQADGTCEGWYDATNMIWHLTDYEYSDNVEVIAWREQLAPYQPKGE